MIVCAYASPDSDGKVPLLTFESGEVITRIEAATIDSDYFALEIDANGIRLRPPLGATPSQIILGCRCARCGNESRLVLFCSESIFATMVYVSGDCVGDEGHTVGVHNMGPWSEKHDEEHRRLIDFLNQGYGKEA